jgi:LCP family protein required for cell wall assembly
MNKGKEQSKKILKIVLVSIVACIMVIGLVAFVGFKSYIGKMNLVTETGKADIIETVDPEELDEVNASAGAVDASKEEVDTLEDQIRKNMEENSKTIKSDKDVLNILLIGSDTRTTGKSGRSDAMIVVSVNKNSKKIVATSLLRDIYLQIPGASNNRINAAFAYGGADLLMETIKNNFKIDIDRYVSIDFYAFMKVVDIVGGVNVKVTDKDISIMNNYIKGLNSLTGSEVNKDLITSSGNLDLNGIQTLAYVRNRYIGTDFARTSKQREVLEKVFNKVKGSNIIELNKILNTILPEVTTNLTEGEIFSLILNVPAFSKYSIEQWSVPAEGTYNFLRIRGMDVIGIDFETNITKLQDKIY